MSTEPSRYDAASMVEKIANITVRVFLQWAEPDLNRRPFDYQSNAPAVLSYRPIFSGDTKVNIKLVNKNFRKPPSMLREWARSLARIKVSAFGAGDRGFKSHRARFSAL